MNTLIIDVEIFQKAISALSPYVAHEGHELGFPMRFVYFASRDGELFAVASDAKVLLEMKLEHKYECLSDDGGYLVDPAHLPKSASGRIRLVGDPRTVCESGETVQRPYPQYRVLPTWQYAGDKQSVWLDMAIDLADGECVKIADIPMSAKLLQRISDTLGNPRNAAVFPHTGKLGIKIVHPPFTVLIAHVTKEKKP